MRELLPASFDCRTGLCDARAPMTPGAEWILVVCAVVLTIVICATLISLRRTAARAESVLAIVEREIRPLASQVEALAGEMRTLSQTANGSMQRVSAIIGHVEELSLKAARVVAVAHGLTSIRGITGVASGAKTGLSVFLSRLLK